MGEEVAIDQIIEELWDMYDDDGNGELDLNETRQFLKDALGAMNHSSCFNEKAFLNMFRMFDTDGNGMIDKYEMRQFIKKIISDHGHAHG